MNCDEKFPVQVEPAGLLIPESTNTTLEPPPGVFVKLKGDPAGVQVWPTAAGRVAHDAEEKNPGKMKFSWSVPRPGAESNERNVCGANPAPPVTSGGLLRLLIVAVVPPSAAKDPVGAGPMVALSGGKGAWF